MLKLCCASNVSVFFSCMLHLQNDITTLSGKGTCSWEGTSQSVLGCRPLPALHVIFFTMLHAITHSDSKQHSNLQTNLLFVT
jgi:hypothetical protein